MIIKQSFRVERFIQILSIYLTFISMINCLSFTEAQIDTNQIEKQKNHPTIHLTHCDINYLNYTLFRDLNAFGRMECSFTVDKLDLKIEWVREDLYVSSFITPMRELTNLGMIPVSIFAYIGLIPNYEERRAQVTTAVSSKNGVIWNQKYYQHYETWSSLVLIPAMPVYALLRDESPQDQALQATINQMIGDLQARGMLPK